MPNCDFNNIACLFRAPFPKNTFRGLLLYDGVTGLIYQLLIREDVLEIYQQTYQKRFTAFFMIFLQQSYSFNMNAKAATLLKSHFGMGVFL